MKVFIDAGVFNALTDADDEHHRCAVTFYRDTGEKGVRFITTNFVVCETMDYFRARISRRVAVLFMEKLKKSGITEIVTVTPSIEEDAFAVFKRYRDKDFSFKDCTSFSLMKHLKFRKAFAFDKHFEQIEGMIRVS